MAAAQPLSPDELLETLRGRRCGIIQDFTLLNPAAGGWPWYYGSARTCDVGLLAGAHSWHPPCGGIGLSREQTMMSVLGETLERYCAAFRPRAGIQRGSEKQLRKRFALFSPDELSRFSSAQTQRKEFHYMRYDKDAELEWIPARSLGQEQELLVPAAWTLLPYTGDSHYYIDANSTGLACGSDNESAIENAVFEVIERDAYSLCWLYQGAPPRLSIQQEDWAVACFPVLQHQDWEVDVYDLTGRSGFPVLLVVLRAPRSYGDRHGPWLTHGVACHLDARQAFEKASREAMLAYYYLESKWQHFFSETSMKQKKISAAQLPADFDGNADFYNLYPSLLEHTRFLQQGGTFRWGDTPGTREACSHFTSRELYSRLAQAGLEAAWVDLTTRDIKPLGLHVVRVLIKGLNWLHADTRWPYLGTAHAQRPHEHYHYISEGAALNQWPHALG